ncbi:MAG: alkaline phosphatase family protein, partial [Clostridia bacterium]|nr:alkaline phosphatase family protein [Clostridia bacterium]
VRPIAGLCEVLRRAGKKNAFFYNWEELRDLARPDSLMHSYFYSGHQEGWYETANKKVTDAALSYIAEEKPDFVFLYLGWTDEAGHKYGWMTEDYMHAVKESWKDIKRVTDAFSDEYTVIVTADHGGHDRSHGTDMPEDMTIPVFFMGERFPENKTIENVSILDLAPTIATLLGAEPDAEWEGKSLI